MDASHHTLSQELVQSLQRRLHVREIQATQLGISADPSILIEIEDLRNKIEEIEQRGQSIPEKTLVYRTLWNEVEELHIRTRLNDIAQDEFDNNLRHVNSFILRNSLLVDAKDAVLINRYLDLLFKSKQLINRYQDKEVQRKMSITSPLSSEDFDRGTEIRTVAEDLDKTRNQLIRRFRKVIGVATDR